MPVKIIYRVMYLPILPYKLYVVKGVDNLKRMPALLHCPDLLKFDDGADPTNEESMIQGGVIHVADGVSILYLPDFYDVDTIYHEALHLATHMWYYVGANLEVPRNDEVLTYTVGYIARWVISNLYPEFEDMERTIQCLLKASL